MLKSWSKKLLIIALELFLISGVFWYLIQKKESLPNYNKVKDIVSEEIQKIQPEENKVSLPAQSGAVKKTYNWQYKGVNYELTETLYQTSYDFYKAQPKSYSYVDQLPQNWEDEYYGMFLKEIEGDSTIENLANDITALGKKHNLNSDQIVELALSFVQAIPYDDAKAKQILAKDGNANVRYPYEVLFDNLGVCSDKSILASVILRQMGYGTALFAYEEDNHMALGIECPKDSSTYGNGYCYAETTSIGNKIGIIPNFDQSSNKTVDSAELKTFDENQISNSNLKQLGQVTILQASQGKLYGGVAATQKLFADIASLKKKINDMLPNILALKKKITNEENELNNLRDQLNKYKNQQNIEKYNSLVGEYNDLLEKYKKDVEKFNSSVTIYNQTIARYNL